jgi:hypothetical protein
VVVVQHAIATEVHAFVFVTIALPSRFHAYFVPHPLPHPSLLRPSFSRSSCIHPTSRPTSIPRPPIRVHHLPLFGITRGVHAFVDERNQDEKSSLDIDGKIDIIIFPHP